jgi:hypothetical protein
VRWFLGNPMAHLVTYAAMLTTCFAAFLWGRTPPPPKFGDVASVGWGLMLILWMDADARRRRMLPCYDFGFLAGVFFPFSLVWYCIWSRGWRGVFVFIGLLTLFIAPYTITGLLWWVAFRQD